MNPGTYEAIVRSVDWSKRRALVSLQIAPKLTYEARMLRDMWTKDQRTKRTTPVDAGAHGDHVSGAVLGGHDHGPHDHRLADDLNTGDHVLVAFLNGRSDSPVVIGVLL